MHELVSANTSSSLQHYDPEKGLLALAAAEAAHKHFARAKNLDGLTKAIEAKLKEQRNFVLWWDRMGEKRGKHGLAPCFWRGRGDDRSAWPNTLDADSVRARLASCAVAALYADARRRETSLPAA